MPEMVAKRTYNLPPSTIDEVRSLAATLHVSQDSVVSRAVQEYARMQRDLTHTAEWAKAVDDPEFQVEMSAVTSGFAAADVASWEG